MRGNLRIGRRAGGALVTLLAAGVLTGAAPSSSAPVGAGSRATDPPQEVEGGVVVDLADGDRFKVTVARDLRTVWGHRYDASTGTWGARSVVLRKKNLYCGSVDARAAGQAVAVIATCDRSGYADDQAPTHSQALWSTDTVTWRTATLPGEAYDEPGISPSGNAAVWPIEEGWATWTAAGFTVVREPLPGQEYTVTATISDAGDVSVLYGAPLDRGRTCALQVLTVPAAGPSTRQQLPVPSACSDVDLSNLDALTVRFGDPSDPARVTTVSRPDTTAPWAVTGIAPVRAPGLVRHRGRGTATTLFVTSPGLPLLAVGSADEQHFTAQDYDPQAQAWSTPRSVGAPVPGCTWGDNFIQEQLGVLALRLRCGRHQRLLASADATTWHDLRVGRSPLGVSPDRQYVAVSNRVRTLVLSRERGLVRLPVGTRARCDVVQPVAPDAAVRLTSTRGRTGWPDLLQESTARGWRRTGTDFPRLPVGRDRCRTVDVDIYERPVSYSFTGRTRVVSLAAVPRGDGWRIRRTEY